MLPKVRDGYPLPRCDESVSRARMWVRISLMGDYGEDVLGPALLIMSELATNAVQHAAKTVTIKVICQVDDDVLTLGVLDYSRREPVMLNTEDYDEYGRGLALVDALADEWGYEQRDMGKIVYARLKLPPASGVSHLGRAPDRWGGLMTRASGKPPH
jgi:anti-sigma regulatory factor (Ser/Thr protein kinase)